MNARREDISLLYIVDEDAARERMPEFLNCRSGRIRAAEHGAERLGDAIALQRQRHDVGRIHAMPEMLKNPDASTDQDLRRELYGV